MTNSPAYLWYPRDVFDSERVEDLSPAEECWYRRALDRSCGDWERILKPAVTLAGEDTTSNGTAAIFFDPPYSTEANRSSVYTHEDFSVAHAVRNWCIKHGDNPQMKIALCGYDVEHTELEEHGWSPFSWTAVGGYSTFADKGNQSHANKDREVIWFSPHCKGDNVIPNGELFS